MGDFLKNFLQALVGKKIACSTNVIESLWKKCLAIHYKYKYFDATVQRAEDRRQKFYFCRLP